MSSLTTFLCVILVSFELVSFFPVTLFLLLMIFTAGFSTTSGTSGAVFNCRTSSCLAIENEGGCGLPKLPLTFGKVLRNSRKNVSFKSCCLNESVFNLNLQPYCEKNKSFYISTWKLLTSSLAFRGKYFNVLFWAFKQIKNFSYSSSLSRE